MNKFICRNLDGSNPLINATIKNNEKEISLILTCGANIEETDNYGDTAASIAAYYGNIATLKLLLEKGADRNVVNEFGENLLMRSIEGRNRETFDFLLNKLPVDFQDIYGLTALHKAIINEDLYMGNELLQKGANPLIKDKNNMSSFDEADYRGNSDIVRALSQKTDQGCTGLQ